MIISLGLVGAYICLSMVLLLLFIKSKHHYITKTILIAIMIWYGLALYYTPYNLMGWPVATSNIADGSKIISFRIREPSPTTCGAIYFWLNTKPIKTNKTFMELLDPRMLFSYGGEEHPRAYRVPYSRELHERLLEIKRSQKSIPGSYIVMSKSKGKEGKKGGEGRAQDKDIKSKRDQFKFDIINPIEILTKD